MEIQQLTMATSIASIFISVLALMLSITIAIIMVAREKATHTVQLVPVDEEVQRANDEYSAALKRQNDLHKEETELEFPEFALDDDDKEVWSV